MPKATVKLEELKTWTSDYAATRQHKRETMNVVFHLSDLVELVNFIKKENDTGASINAVRFYLVRQNEMNGNPSRRDIVYKDDTGKAQSQISLVAVPVNNYDINIGGNDYIRHDEVECIYPFDERHEHTGLCPHNCGGSLNNEQNAQDNK